MTTLLAHRHSSSSGWKRVASIPAALSSELRSRPATNDTCGGTCASRWSRTCRSSSRASRAKAFERRYRFFDSGDTRHQAPPRTSDIPPHSNPRGEDAASGSQWDSRADSFSDWQRPAFFRGHSLRAPLQNDLGQGRMQRNVVLGVFGLDVVHPAVHKAALNDELVMVNSQAASCSMGIRTRQRRCRLARVELRFGRRSGWRPARRSALPGSQYKQPGAS